MERREESDSQISRGEGVGAYGKSESRHIFRKSLSRQRV